MPKSNVDPSASALHREPTIEIPTDELAALKEIERRILWLSTLMIHHANNVRPSLEKIEGRRSPGVFGVGRLDHHRALFPFPSRRRPSLDQAARLAGLPRRPVPARPSRPQIPDRRCANTRAAGLSEPHQGPGSGRFLDRFGRARRGRAGLRRPGRTSTPSCISASDIEPLHLARSAMPSSTRATSGRPSPRRRSAASAT